MAGYCFAALRATVNVTALWRSIVSRLCVLPQTALQAPARKPPFSQVLFTHLVLSSSASVTLRAGAAAMSALLCLLRLLRSFSVCVKQTTRGRARDELVENGRTYIAEFCICYHERVSWKE